MTSESFWRSALVTGLIDAILVALLAWRIKKDRFRQLRWPLVGTAAVFWSAFGLLLYRVFWDSYYRYFAADWLRGGGILLVTVPMGVVLALLFHWAALRLLFDQPDPPPLADPPIPPSLPHPAFTCPICGQPMQCLQSIPPFDRLRAPPSARYPPP